MPVGNESSHELNGATIVGGLAFKNPGSGAVGYLSADSVGNVVANNVPTAAAPIWAAPRAVARTQVTAFQTGHSWVTNGAAFASSNLNDTADYALGSQSVKMVSNGTAGQCRIRRTAGTNFDATGKQGRIWLKCDDITHLSRIDLIAGNATFANTYFWTLWQSGAGSNWMQSGEWVQIVFSWQDIQPASGSGTPVRATITDWQLALVDDGTGNNVTLHVGGLALEPAPSTYANGVVSVVFDDGLSSQFSTARPLMDANGQAATAYVIADAVGASGSMTLAQLTQAQEMSRWEIAGHAFQSVVHSQANSYNDLSLAAVDADQSALRGWLYSNAFRGYDHLGYPHGNFSPTNLPTTKKYFKSARTILSTLTETLPPADLYRLRCKTVLDVTTTSSVQALVDATYTEKGWLILLFHDIVTTSTSSTQYSTANFTTIVNYLLSKGIAVAPVGDVLRSIGAVT